MPKKNIYIYLHCACIGNWKEVLGKIKKNINSSGLYEKANEIRCSVIGDVSEFLSFMDHGEKYKVIFHSNESQYLKSNWHKQTEHLNLFKAFSSKSKLTLKEIDNYDNPDWWTPETEKNMPVGRPIHNEQIIIDQIHKDAQEEDAYVCYIHTKGVKRYVEEGEKYKFMRDWLDLLLYFNIQKHVNMIECLDEFDVAGIGLITWVSPEQRMKDNGIIRKTLPSKGDRPIFDGNFWWSKSRYLRTLDPTLSVGYVGPELWVTQIPESKLISLWNSEKDHYSESYDSSEYIGKKLQRHTYKGEK